MIRLYASMPECYQAAWLVKDGQLFTAIRDKIQCLFTGAIQKVQLITFERVEFGSLQNFNRWFNSGDG
jgi:hypothetical protein